jgi:hypothetical protein
MCGQRAPIAQVCAKGINECNGASRQSFECICHGAGWVLSAEYNQLTQFQCSAVLVLYCLLCLPRSTER